MSTSTLARVKHSLLRYAICPVRMILRSPASPSLGAFFSSSKMIKAIVEAVRSRPVSFSRTLMSSPARMIVAI